MILVAVLNENSLSGPSVGVRWLVIRPLQKSRSCDGSMNQGVAEMESDRFWMYFKGRASWTKKTTVQTVKNKIIKALEGNYS